MPCWEFFSSCDSTDIDGAVVARVKLHGGAVVVDHPVRSVPQLFHHRRDHHPGEGDQLAEDEPDVDHLDVGRRGQALGHADEQGRDHEEHGDVGGDKPFEEKLLEVVGHVADDVDDQGRQEGGQDDAQQPPLDCHLVFKMEKVGISKHVQ